MADIELQEGRILIVDDQAYNRELLAYLLSDYGYTFAMAANGKEAVEAIEADDTIDLVLMDVSMPVMDGFEATRLIKAKTTGRYQPVVFVTALDDEQTLAKCLEVGGDDFIPKPVNLNVLLAKVKANQRSAALYRQLQESNTSLLYHQKVMDREHAIVEHVFRNGMQRVDMQCRNIRYSITPLSMFNGDLMLTAPNPSGGVYVMLGDFTGHGLSAAIGCLPVSDIFYAMTKKHADVGDIAFEINLRLQSLLPSYMFFCAAILELSVNGDRLSYWNGGMNDILMIAPGGGVADRLTAQHMPLGVLECDEFDRSITTIKPEARSRIFVYTDGVIEARNSEGEFFGEERLGALFNSPRESYLQTVSEAVAQFQQAQSDDISLFELHCEPVVFDNPAAAEAYLEVRSSNVSLPWNLHCHLEAEELRSGEVVHQFIRLVANETSLARHKDVLFTLISELFNNALEHGLLGMNSADKYSIEGFSSYYSERLARLESLEEGAIDISLKLTGEGNSLLELSISHTGQAFDVAAVRQAQEQAPPVASGYGIKLVEGLCESVEYSDDGRSVTAVYPLISTP
ncbi:MAG: two-component system response regulator HsbR [Candidatus Pelagadaptatus aseana]|uniref:ATP-binding SpoIIE family protein phosphatase n=1 Tax=Candidatus Pelagadaptatus aseana TaxID=3120508 RepID=UPI0039B25040